jgi:hypothetical protein
MTELTARALKSEVLEQLGYAQRIDGWHKPGCVYIIEEEEPELLDEGVYKKKCSCHLYQEPNLILLDVLLPFSTNWAIANGFSGWCSQSFHEGNKLSYAEWLYKKKKDELFLGTGSLQNIARLTSFLAALKSESEKK